MRELPGANHFAATPGWMGNRDSREDLVLTPASAGDQSERRYESTSGLVSSCIRPIDNRADNLVQSIPDLVYPEALDFPTKLDHSLIAKLVTDA